MAIVIRTGTDEWSAPRPPAFGKLKAASQIGPRAAQRAVGAAMRAAFLLLVPLVGAVGLPEQTAAHGNAVQPANVILTDQVAFREPPPGVAFKAGISNDESNGTSKVKLLSADEASKPEAPSPAAGGLPSLLGAFWNQSQGNQAPVAAAAQPPEHTAGKGEVPYLQLWEEWSAAAPVPASETNAIELAKKEEDAWSQVQWGHLQLN